MKTGSGILRPVGMGSSLLVVTMSLVLAISGLALAKDGYRIGPAVSPEQINPLPSQGWKAMNDLPKREHDLYKLTYLRGFLDALRFSEAVPDQILDVLDEFKGLELSELAIKIDEFYSTYPKYVHISPATVMVVILPRLKQGLPPFPGDENGQTPENGQANDHGSTRQPAEN